MDRAETFAPLTLVPSVYLNLQQDVTPALRASTEGYLSAMGDGGEGQLWQSSSDLNTATLVAVAGNTVEIVDPGTPPSVPASITTAAIDWNDREVKGMFRGFAGATEYPGGANDYLFDASGAPVMFWGYLGRGGLTGGGLAPSPGNPPVPAAGTSWAIQIAANLWLYLDSADGKLKLYNNTGATIRTPSLWFTASAPTGKRP